MSVASERWVRAAKALAGLLAVAAIFALVWFLTLGRHDELATLSGHKDGTFALVLSPDGTEVASGGGDGEIRIWDVASKQTKTVLKGHVSDDLLNGDTTPMPPLGARDPKDLPK